MRDLRVLILGFIATTSVVAAAGGASPQTVQVVEGKQKYDVYCASCHGPEGKGDGVLAKSLSPRPADLTQLAKKNKGQFPTDRIVKLVDGRTRDEPHSKSDMPIWGDVFSQSRATPTPEDVKARIEGLVKYLETIQDKS